MTIRGFFRGPIGRSLAVVLGLALVSGVAPRVAAQSSTTTISGVILDPAGVPSKGFRVVFRDVASNTRYTSTATDALGNYIVEVPLGGRYKIDAVIADDAVTKLPVDDLPPINVLTTERMRVDVRFRRDGAPGAPAAGATSATGETAGKVPWYKKPGPITGLVLVSVGVAALVLQSGGGEASPYTPPPADR